MKGNTSLRIFTIIRFAAGIAVLVLFFIYAVSVGSSVDKELFASVDSGFYDRDFYLELSAPGYTQIYYTLDSGTPDEGSILYMEPILISDASDDDNVYSLITDVSLDFRNDLLEQAGVSDRYGYEIPAEPVDKATVVRAVAIDGFGNRSDVITRVYWIGYSAKEAYDNYNIISITTDPVDLFDYDKGIYVTGRAFDDILDNGKIPEKLGQFFGLWPANYNLRGREAEREAHITLWDKDHKLILDGEYGIRIQGGNSRGAANKSLNIYARKQYGRDTIDGTGIFKDGYTIKSMNLNCGGNSYTYKLPDCMLNSLIGDLHLPTLPYQPCMLFLDGEFWGLYWLTPRYETSYYEAVCKVHGDDVIEIKTGNVEIGEAKDIDVYNEMVRRISSLDMSIPENYNEACNLIDMDSCIDYYATEIYIANDDWPDNNVVLWRTKTVSPGEYSDGKWRWIVYDVNRAMFYIFSRSDWIEHTIERDRVFASLMRNDKFKRSLESRLVYLAENNFNPDTVDKFIDEYKTLMSDGMALEYERFYGEGRTLEDFYSDCENIRSFFNERYEYITETYGED